MPSPQRKVWRSSHQRAQDKAQTKVVVAFLLVVGGLLLAWVLLTIGVEYLGVTQRECGSAWTGSSPRYSCSDVGGTQARLQALWSSGGDAVVVRHPVALWLARPIFAVYAAGACWLLVLMVRSLWRSLGSGVGARRRSGSRRTEQRSRD
ncbi:hypothetical protein [Nocardioides sp. Iso805N]|uniref:hypothetical protein n=1 Tax=Nocardioides sp. Iso805N TaxID=1283287 RepID=UPI000380C9C6|nr:hypothetical protein [Nocardioides sp. Iso805N]